jgi:hypothetical protein
MPFKPTKLRRSHCSDECRTRNENGCRHPKPLFKNGKPRKFCYECVPAPEKKERGQNKLRYARVCASPSCGRDFMAKMPDANFCSSKCRSKVYNRKKQERSRDRSPRKCGFCEVAFTPDYGDLRQKYCSIACQLSYRYRATSGTTHRRRARKFGCEYEKVDKLSVFERDGWRCKICGIKTPRSKMGKRIEGAPELGHVVSLRDGGPHSYSNTQCECFGCNRSKGSKSLGQLQLGL